MIKLLELAQQHPALHAWLGSVLQVVWEEELVWQHEQEGARGRDDEGRVDEAGRGHHLQEARHDVAWLCPRTDGRQGAEDADLLLELSPSRR